MSGTELPDSQESLIFENQIAPMWVSTKVAAAILGISPNALRIRKCRGEIECRYDRNHLRFNLNYLRSIPREARGKKQE